ncbi:hypothetical protein SAMN06265173_108115 [Thalassovita litoralis]|uniref:Uncharacterized protein n=1 Tax=Thalassovita litoralis TaxID=1010611 RepID=A0A521D1R5_9RHOB|nr:hypothetical protein [Thalassovita litoralis]SMO65643.1 hypothetical protein SAMN06265173_108115 [Thalassovita litoralis]
MQQDWVATIPSLVYFIIGLGGVAGALLAIVKLWQVIRPASHSTEQDIERIKEDVHDIRGRVVALEIEVAKIDQPAIVKRFDGIEGKIDRLYEFLLERFSDSAPDRKR